MQQHNALGGLRSARNQHQQNKQRTPSHRCSDRWKEAAFTQLSVVKSAEQNEGQHCTEECPPHVGLRIPDVALCAEKRVGGFFG
jgi:hypothetical protein